MSIRTLVITKFYGATNTRGSRIKVTAHSGRSVFVEWNYAAGVTENHAVAALCGFKTILAKHPRISRPWSVVDSFNLPNESGMAHVLEGK